MYYTTPIYEFRMKCHLCSGHLTMRTDPKNATYDCVAGLRRKVEEWDASEEMAHHMTEEEKAKLEQDAFYRLEHQKTDREKLMEQAEELERLQELNERNWEDPWARSKELRRRAREDKKDRMAVHKEAKQIQDKYGLAFNVAPKNVVDESETIKVDFEQSEAKQQHDRKRALLEGGSIFGSINEHLSQLTREQLLEREVKRKKLAQDLSQPQLVPTALGIRKKPNPPTDTEPTTKPALLIADYTSSDDDVE